MRVGKGIRKASPAGDEAAGSEAEALQGPASGERGQLRRPGGVRNTTPSIQPLQGAPPQPPLLFCCCCFLEKNGLQKRTSTPTQIGLNATEHGNLTPGNLSTSGALRRARVSHLKVFSHEGESGSTPPRDVNTSLCPTLSQPPALHPVLPHLLPSLPVSSPPTSLPAAFPVTLCSRNAYLPVISLTNQPTGAQRNSVTSVTTRKMTSLLFLSQRLKLWTKLFAGKEEGKVGVKTDPTGIDERSSRSSHQAKTQAVTSPGSRPRRAVRGVPQSRAETRSARSNGTQ